MVDIELLKRLAEACDIERCADEEERDRNLNEFYSVLEPEDVAALIAENEALRASLGAPEEITVAPCENYDGLRKQFAALRTLANSKCRMAEHWARQVDRLTREVLMGNADSVNAERETNAMLTDALEAAEAERDQLRAELDAANRHWANESNNVQAAVAEIARLKAENERLQAEQQEKIAWEAAPGLGICRYVTEARYRKFAPNIQRHYRPYTGDAAELERVKAEGLALLVTARPFLASRLTELPSIRERVENPDAVDRAVEKLSALVSHIDAAMGKGGDV